MTTLTVNIENEKDLPAITEFLNQYSVTYNVEEEYDEALEAALDEAEKESEAGLGRPHEEVWAEITARFKK